MIVFDLGEFALKLELYRFIGVVLLNYVDPALMLSIHGFACSAFSLGVALAHGKAGIGCLFALFFFESICYPVRVRPKYTPKITHLH